METINLHQKTNAREQILALLALLALVVLFFRIIYVPNRDLKAQLENQRENLILERGALLKFNEALLATITQTAPKEESRPTEKMQMEISTLLRTLTSHDFLGGVMVKKMSDIPAITDKGFQRISFFIEINGRFQNIIDYLNRVQQLAALITIDQITLKVSETKAARIDLELNGTLFQLEDSHEIPIP